jgi:hypothetical protein
MRRAFFECCNSGGKARVFSGLNSTAEELAEKIRNQQLEALKGRGWEEPSFP